MPSALQVFLLLYAPLAARYTLVDGVARRDEAPARDGHAQRGHPSFLLA